MADKRSETNDEKPRIQLGRKQYKGIWMFDNEIEQIEVMDTREDDIWICTFPRSGTTLTQEIAFLVQTLDFDRANTVQLDDRFPIIEVKDDRFPYYRGIKFVEEMRSPRMIKCHLHHFMLPEQLQKGKGRIIYVARNPKDIVTSFFRLMQWGDGLNETDGTWDLFVDAFVSGTGHNGSWSRHVLEFWQRRNDPNVLFLKYEDIVKDMPKAVRRIADFLKRQITDDDVARICEHCHVDNMRKNDKVNMSYWRDVKKVYDNLDGGFINKGKAGAWKDLLTPDKVEKINGLLKEIEGSGLTFDEE
ncbi:sulfotransferase 4A1-like [Ruditapes philippinarum]|uniref:sulfotransferase 4A1-like n=1 Tax=Ruditapes philippinarum TaxID=129788 RepID=UPI00295A7AF2|nr:sulfotransferase 4A1-like [Ruditapes philippinarum]